MDKDTKQMFDLIIGKLDTMDSRLYKNIENKYH
ncbi:hypothetical protein CLHOM_07420 [Clostridium homopropionicum DSM 5847]|uniref:Uncharacterized protein n=1 Tax=Clostridium homopropionicum DSM 5847 TaxID=1121318 RepID=A0A0L6ZCA5_9CLOT|nr:hypothetical protein CLHOM_07420 [Clostridium homopropionicum DSM 5847]